MREEQRSHGSLTSYTVGFILSLVLTLGAYFLTQHHVNSGHVSPSDSVMKIALLALAVAQLYVQLFFFLHLGREAKPRWRSMAFAFALLVVLIVVIGSLWIMDNLNYRMSPQQINNYLKDQNGGI
ncbi:MAG TPA: cytochrome o ubiquinol oxidase subunit IV [Candidatus Saccharimonadales bacterium]|nr:cytochrome o ubiquinol oxidase subunit IV [Candidatus Saccharimonadales bacterium]